MSNQNDNNDEKLLDHNYDGIQELDNPLPRWWLLTFYGAIVFAALFWWYYEINGAPDAVATFRDEVTELRVQRALNAPAGPTEEILLAALSDAQGLATGKDIYIKNCAACHAVDGGGGIGPNLTDDYHLHGDGKIATIYPIIQKGIPEKGMPPWGGILKEPELIAITAFVKSLHGKPAANPKAPQGEKHATN
jgi:cytochrome c oxidase cbb3-type subunit 3